MATMHRDEGGDLSVVQDRHVAMLGYSSQARAQALSLRDSGVDVRIGMPPDASHFWRAAEAEGLRVVAPFEACEEANLVVVQVPEQSQRKLYAEAIEPNLVDGDAVLFGDGFNIRFGFIEPPLEVDVVLVAPTANGQRVRDEYVEGRGVPVLVAVEQDATGEAWDVALSYAKAIGGLRAGGIETTFGEQADTSLFAQQAVLCGGVPQLVLKGYETLTAAGYQPEVAYLECVQELKRAVDLMYERGIDRRRLAGSDLAELGGYAGGPRLVDSGVEQSLREVLVGIRDGTFARRFIDDQDAGGNELAAFRVRAEHHPIETVGRQLRALLPWIRGDTDESRLGRG